MSVWNLQPLPVSLPLPAVQSFRGLLDWYFFGGLDEWIYKRRLYDDFWISILNHKRYCMSFKWKVHLLEFWKKKISVERKGRQANVLIWKTLNISGLKWIFKSYYRGWGGGGVPLLEVACSTSCFSSLRLWIQRRNVSDISDLLYQIRLTPGSAVSISWIPDLLYLILLIPGSDVSNTVDSRICNILNTIVLFVTEFIHSCRSISLSMRV